MLPESRLHSFIDSEKKYALRFLEGQKLISDLATIHPLHGSGFAFFRDLVLSSQSLVAFLKGREHLGFYIESEDPFFTFKIEINEQGLVRCLLLPETFLEFPNRLNGIARVIKMSPKQKTPYQSIIELRDKELNEVVNQVLKESYQIQAITMLSETGDQALMLHQLPSLDPNAEMEPTEGLEQCMAQYKEGFNKIFASTISDPEELQTAFAEIGFQRLAGKTIKFQCDCSKEQMVQKILTLPVKDQDSLFNPGEDTLEIVCEYCKSKKIVSKEDLQGRVNLPS